MRCVAPVVLLLALPLQAFTQSLAEVAEREKKRREELKKWGAASGQAFSDHDLPGSWTTWCTFSPPGAGFSVQFPAAPVLSEDPVATPQGTAPRKVYRAVKDKREYVVMAVDYPAALVKRLGAEAIFDLAEKQARQDFKGGPYTRYASVWRGRPARDFQLRSDMVGDDDTVFLSFDGRMVLDGGRLYVQVQLLHNGPDTVGMPAEFMSSLAIATPPPPSGRP